MSEATERAVLESVPDGLLIDGKWRPAASGRTLDVHDPATGDVIRTVADGGGAAGAGGAGGTVGAGGVADGAEALDAAVAAGPGWARTPPRERGEVLRRAFDLLQD